MAIKQVTEYVGKLRGPRSAVVKELRKIIKGAAPEAEESFKWAQPVYEVNGPFCYLSAHSDHVRMGFWRGVDLRDPNGLLVGTGKMMRHVKIRSVKEIQPKVLKRFVKEAVALNRKKGNPVSRAPKN
ncbi:MAG: DUF1801 domain-containing protein [Planctomycetota bacterium]|jgi:hypothetical protein